MNEPAAYSWSAVLYELYSGVFPKSVHILEILMLYQPGIYLPRKMKVEPDLSLVLDELLVRYEC